MSRRLIWRRTAPSFYDLVLDNPQDLDKETLGRLFQTFITSECKPQPNLNQYLREDLDRWVHDPSAPLLSAAYVSLSNWFLTGQSSMLASPRSAAARSLWNYLFSCEPNERMSSPESGQNHIIISEQFERWWLEQVRLQGTMTNPQSEPNSIAPRFAELCSATFLPLEFFEDCEELLTTKKQLILQGAPGTGKTFVAKHLANWWAVDPARTMLVQFHESYGYEDFVHGIKPIEPRDGIVGFAPHDGTLVQLSEEARKYPDHRYVLIIDEINRGKPARVFGELLYLLEYRNESVILQSGKKFSLPPNLYFIGTMNTVDKSIALVDYALRRRFGFATLQSVKDGKSVVLGPWLRREGVTNASEIEAIFVTLNKLIAAKDEGLMIGHSYFMLRPKTGEGKISEKSLQFVWRYYILPLVAEYEYELSASKIAEKYGLETIRRLAQAEVSQA
jgi:5-methylcytosine-specific restriction protein B